MRFSCLISNFFPSRIFSVMCFPICEKEEMELSPPSPQNELGDFQGTRHWRSMALDTLKPGEISKKYFSD